MVLGRTFPRRLVAFVLEGATGFTKIIPQEGLLDELLLGLDWWTVKREALREMVGIHPGLQAANSIDALHPVGTGTPAPRPVEKRPPQRSIPSPRTRGQRHTLPPSGPTTPLRRLILIRHPPTVVRRGGFSAYGGLRTCVGETSLGGTHLSRNNRGSRALGTEHRPKT